MKNLSCLFRRIGVMLLLFQFMFLRAENVFKIANLTKSTDATSIPIDFNNEFTSSTVLAPFSSNTPIEGLSINGTIEPINSDFIVRILLQDTEGRRYLVAEAYREICDKVPMILDDYCEETAILNGIVPDSLLISVRGAKVKLNGISILPSSKSLKRQMVYSEEALRTIKKAQVGSVVERINAYNKAHNKLWIAGATSLSQKPYEVRKRVLGLSDDGLTGGIEYYVGGIFEIGNIEQASSPQRSSSYVDSFDWRNRHGKDWTTPVKDQGNSCFCVPFTACSCAEAYVNLYFNRKIDLDLSEQQIGSCHPNYTNVYSNGMYLNDALFYVKYFGVYDETAYPFVDDSIQSQFCRAGHIVPNERVWIDGYQLVSTNEDSIKSKLIHKGPLASGIHTKNTLLDWEIKHAMALIGYGTIHVGDSIFHIIKEGTNTTLQPIACIEDDHDSRIGKTYWIFKDSYVGKGGLTPEYMYILFDSPLSMITPYFFKGDVTWKSKNEQGSFDTITEITCEDADGDGYYFWGIGPKPASCPSWAPDEPDGDDSDYQWGPINEYGYLQALDSLANNIQIISGTETWSSPRYLYENVRVVSGGHLIISDSTCQYGRTVIEVDPNGELTIDGGTLRCAEILLNSGAKLNILNDGVIQMRQNKEFNAPVGATVTIIKGVITNNASS